MNKASGLNDDQTLILLRLAATMAEQQRGLKENKGNFPLSNPSMRLLESVPPGGGIAPS